MKDEKKTDIIEKPQYEAVQNRYENLLDEMDMLFDRFRNSFDSIFLNPLERIRRPPLDVVDLGDKYQMKIESPGIPKENINIEVSKNEIEISGEYTEEKEDKDGSVLRQERGKIDFYRCLEFPDDIKDDEVKAEMKDGVLEIILPKVEPKPKLETKKVEIK